MVEKAFLNKKVLSNFLKLSMFGAILTSRGKLFHKFGAGTMKDLSPNDSIRIRTQPISTLILNINKLCYVPWSTTLNSPIY